MFTPPVGGGHGHEPLTIAMGGGRFDGAADGGTAPRRHPDWIRARLPTGENYQDLKGLDARPGAQHGVRGGPLPQHRRVLGAAHGDGHDPGRHLHARLRLLRRQDRPARRGTTRTSRDASPRRSARWASSTCVVTSVARDDLPDGGAHIFAETIRALRARVPRHGRRGAHPRLQRPGRAAADGHGGRAGHPQPQRRDGRAAPEAGAQARPLPPLARGAPGRQGDGAARSRVGRAPCTPSRA